MEQQGRTVRDTAWNEREYGRDKWPAVAALIDEAKAAGAPPRLPQVVSYVTRREHGRSPESLLQQDAVVSGVSVRAPQSLVLGAYQSLVVETVVEAAAGADAVVELGSGWGRNLFLAWLAGAPANARYVGAELTKAGRDVADAVAALEPALRFESMPFDYGAPDLAAIGGHRQALVFTVHSADMAPELTPAVFEAIRGVAGRVTCVHFENFGWQAGGGDRGDYAREHDYNRNLYELLQAEHAAGRVELDPVLTDVVGLHVDYTTSVAVWRAGR